MRVWVCLEFLAAAALLTGGCALPNWTVRRAAEPEVRADKAVVEKPAAETAVADKPSPFVSERDRTAKSPETQAKSDKPATDAATPAPGSSKVASGRHSFSAETLKLINTELSDASSEERAFWFEQLKHIEPAAIPEILRARRMSLQFAEKPDRADAASVAEQALPVGQAQGVQPAGFAGGHSAAASSPETLTAGSENVETSPASGVMFQNYDAEPLATTAAPIAVQRVPPSAPSRTSPAADQSAGSMPWPPAKTPAASNNRNNLTPPLAFGAGLVQNVVGLIPNRSGAPATAGNGVPVQPAAATTSEAEWRAELARSIALLEQDLAAPRPNGATEDDQRKQVQLRLLYLIADHQERALTAIPGMEPAEQEFWQQLTWGVSNALDSRHIARSEDRAAQTITQLHTAVRRLQERADLQIRNVAFCRQILYFGNYERFPRDEFRPGESVLLYAEIDNFKSEPTADGQYRTLLRSSIELISPSGEVRKVIDFPATEDLCRNYRRDYFHNYQFTIPDRLPLGPHVLKLSVFDELSGKMSSYSLNFLVN